MHDPKEHSRIHLLVAGYYGSGNAGDEAILDCLLTELRAQIPAIDPLVVSAEPAATEAEYQVRAVSKSDKPAVLAAVRDCDAVLLGGGGLLQDYWAMDIGNFFSTPAAHPSYAAYAALAALFDKPLFLYAVGVGPLSTAAGRRCTRMICDQARLLTVRDAESKELLEETGVEGSRVQVTADPAFRLTAPAARLEMESPILGVGLRNWNMGVDSKAWESELAASLDSFLDGPGSILFLPFDHEDVAIATGMQSRLRLPERTAIFEPAGNPGRLAGAIAGCSVVLGMRYHSALFAIRHGIPVVGLVYDPKVRHLLAAAGCEEYAIDIGAFRASDLAALIDRAGHNSEFASRLRPAADRLSEAASQTARLVADAAAVSHTPPPAATRAWLDELTAAASGASNDAYPGLEAVKTTISQRRRHIGPAAFYDIICFPGIEWDFRWMRAQQLMSRFADSGHRVFFISTAAFLPAGGAKFEARSLRANVWELRLAAPQPVDVYSGVMPDDVRAAVVGDIAAAAQEFGIGRAVSMLHLSTWNSAAEDLRARFGWPVVYDCMDDWSGFAWMPQPLLDGEIDLVRDADLVLVTAQKLWGKWSPLNRHTILARNATDIEHFQRVVEAGPEMELPLDRKIVGFFGAIDSWFDVELVRHAATGRPDYFFALIGAVYDAPVERLQQLPNVRFYGHQPYATLPAWLHRFDACIIPFKINTVTQATDPVKFYEYLSQAKPVVATRLPELELYGELLYLADGPEEFVRLLDAAVAEHNPQLRNRRLTAASENTWTARYQLIDSAIQQVWSSRRILFACPVFILGGVEVILQNRAAELLRRGWQVRLVSLEEAGGQVLFEESGIDSRICSSEAELARELADFRPGWIVSIDTPSLLPIARQNAPRAAILYEVHSTYPHILAPLVDRDFLIGIRGIIVPSASQADRIRSLLAADMPIEIVPNALAPEFLRPADPPHASSHPIVLWVGRLDSLKNWRAFLELAAQLRDRTEADFQLISGGPFDQTEGAELERFAADPANRLSWIREVEHARMPAIYRSAAQSGGCMVSTSAAESFGMAVLEAMACGCPVVAPDIEGLRELIHQDETGSLYPPGDLTTAAAQVVKILDDPPERRNQIAAAARQFAAQFSPEAAVERFLAALTRWSTPPEEAKPATPQVTRAREHLSRILAANSGARKIVIFPPCIPWKAASVSSRPQEWARALAAHGCLVFYNDPQHLAVFTEIEPGIIAANVPLEVYDIVDTPVVLAHAGNLRQLDSFRNPLVIYDYQNHAAPDEEWRARAAVIVVDSEELRYAVGPWRPDALLISRPGPEDACAALLAALENPEARENHAVRLKTLLAWRERQIQRLEEQIRERDRPAVEILHGAVTEQKRIISERDKGIAFLRRELANRDRIIAEREAAILFLKHEVEHRDSAIADEVSKNQQHEMREQERQAAIEFLQGEIESLKNEIAARQQGIQSLHQKITGSERDKESLYQEIAVRTEDLQFLHQDIAALDEAMNARDQTIAAREEGIRFLHQEIATRDQTITAREEGIQFLRQEIAARDAEIGRLQATIRHLEVRLPWWRRQRAKD
jgi:polysaccharide pyruvyl transferase CsaB